MKERPILFSGPMVRAITGGTKTQTRRVIRRPESFTRIRDCAFCCPHGAPGDRLWVRETWLPRGAGKSALYKADHSSVDAAGLAGMYSNRGWRPSIFMPRALSRIDLEILSVRVERVNEITQEDALAEGMIGLRCSPHGGSDYPGACSDCMNTGWLVPPGCEFGLLWDTINGKRAPWASNPWVWVVAFKVVRVGAAA